MSILIFILHTFVAATSFNNQGESNILEGLITETDFSYIFNLEGIDYNEDYSSNLPYPNQSLLAKEIEFKRQQNELEMAKKYLEELLTKNKMSWDEIKNQKMDLEKNEERYQKMVNALLKQEEQMKLKAQKLDDRKQALDLQENLNEKTIEDLENEEREHKILKDELDTLSEFPRE